MTQCCLTFQEVDFPHEELESCHPLLKLRAGRFFLTAVYMLFMDVSPYLKDRRHKAAAQLCSCTY